jgi:glycosyltransferase involved in cell wall biosynthesis
MRDATGSRQPRILLIAFACMPGRGSESGTGWAWARIAAGIGETWVLTRAWPGSPEELAEGVRTAPEGERIHPVVIEMPFLFGSRPTGDDSRFERMEYLLWQVRALRAARRIARDERIDLVWHVSWSTAWLGSIGGLVGRPFIWGPIGGGVGTPWNVLPQLGRRGIIAELIRSAMQIAFRSLNPLVRLGWRRADLILAQNKETARWLPRSTRVRTEVFHHVALDAAPSRPSSRPDRPPTALFAGRLVAWKGAWLAIDSIARLDGWRLLVVGAGRDGERLRRRAAERGVADRVTFLGRVERTEVFR